MKHTLQHLEMHISHACNLRCAYCSHYCDIGYSGMVDHAVGGAWMREWSGRVVPDRFYLLGGEPLLNRELDKFIQTAAECFPASKRIVVTNGILLPKVEDLLPLFIRTGTRLHISLHPVPRERKQALEEALALSDKWLRRGLLVSIRPIEGWDIPYRGSGVDILPYAEGTPQECFDRSCGAFGKSCVNLHQGGLWKCHVLAFLPLVFDKLVHKDHWRRFLEYKPLSIGASDDELARFLRLDAAFCDICPAVSHNIGIEEMLRRHPELTVVADKPSFSRVLWRGVGKVRKLLRC